MNFDYSTESICYNDTNEHFDSFLMQEPTSINNDPWTSNVVEDNVNLGNTISNNNLPDSNQYIDSLVKKLEKIKNSRTKEPTAKDIINSLCLSRENHMTRYLNSCCPVNVVDTCINSSCHDSSSVMKRLFPEKQAINEDELIKFAQKDELSEMHSDHIEESLTDDKHKYTNGNANM